MLLGMPPANARRIAQVPNEKPTVAVEARGPLAVRREAHRRGIRPGASAGLRPSDHLKRRRLREGAKVLSERPFRIRIAPHPSKPTFSAKRGAPAEWWDRRAEQGLARRRRPQSCRVTRNEGFNTRKALRASTRRTNIRITQIRQTTTSGQVAQFSTRVVDGVQWCLCLPNIKRRTVPPPTQRGACRQQALCRGRPSGAARGSGRPQRAGGGRPR